MKMGLRWVVTGLVVVCAAIAICLRAGIDTPFDSAASPSGRWGTEPQAGSQGSDFIRPNLQPPNDAISETTRKPLALQKGQSVGSEGFAPGILRAAEVGTSKDALDAAAQIARCAQVDQDVARVFQLKDSSSSSALNAGWLSTVEYIQGEQRKCQTVTGEIAALRPQLLLKAMAGAEWGATAAYIDYVSRNGLSIDATVRPTVIQSLRRDGERGDSNALLLLFGGDPDFSASPTDRRAYKLAYQLITENNPDGLDRLLRQVLEGVLKFTPDELSALDFFRREQMVEDVRAKALTIFEASRARKKEG